MSFWGNTRQRTIFLLGTGVVLFFAVLGGLQAFNTTNVRFLNPESAGETLALTGLTVLVYLLLLLVLLLPKLFTHSPAASKNALASFIPSLQTGMPSRFGHWDKRVSFSIGIGSTSDSSLEGPSPIRLPEIGIRRSFFKRWGDPTKWGREWLAG